MSPPIHWWVSPKDHWWAGWSVQREAAVKAALMAEMWVDSKAVQKAVRTDEWKAKRWAAHLVVNWADMTVLWSADC